MLSHLCLISALTTTAVASQYKSINGLMCMKTDFVKTHSNARSKLECASLCDRTLNCQAFSMADGPCQLFVFDRCSKYVRDCSCSRRSQVFVRQQPGLPPGALCPAGFTDDLCGTKYRLYGGITNWDIARAAVDAEPGLTIMADVTDETEMTHLKGIFSRDSLAEVILGGRQLPGSSEPAGGWYWVGCNTSVSSGLWTSEEPNNGNGGPVENGVSGGAAFSGLNDGALSWSGFAGFLGECVSPFD